MNNKLNIQNKEEKKQAKDERQSTSASLSKNLTEHIKRGNRLNDNSCSSEMVLQNALNNEVFKYTSDIFKNHGIVNLEKSLSLFELIVCWEKIMPLENYKKVGMIPDGGILYLNPFNSSNKIPLLLTEDKTQGTNDKLLMQGKKRQSTGNAIERSAKNIRAAEMLFTGNIFPYLLFCNGCDFHNSETISTRINMMNYGKPNHYINITHTTTPNIVEATIKTNILPKINICKQNNKCVVSAFIKAHKYNEMPHGSSVWTKNEIIIICKCVIDQVFHDYIKSVTQPTREELNQEIIHYSKLST